MVGATNENVLPPLPPPLNPRPTAAAKSTAKPKRTETSNRFHQINTFVDCSLVDLSRSEALTWLVLWRDTKPDGTARTSMGDIARRIGSSRTAIVTAVKKLQQRGLVALIFKGGINRGPSVYCVQPLSKPNG